MWLYYPCGRRGSFGAVARVLWWQRSGCYSEVALVGIMVAVKECAEWLGDPHRGGWWMENGGRCSQAMLPAPQTIKGTV